MNSYLVCPNDGLITGEVGVWAKEKHEYLARYIQISSSARKRFLIDKSKPKEFRAGATYIDLFCGSGRSKVKHTGEWIDGSSVAAWKASLQSGAPFSHIYISDTHQDSLNACEARLKALGANVTALNMNAVDAVTWLQSHLNKYALHFAFIDPFDIKSLNFTLIQSLATFRVDMLIHLSTMDLQRNMASNLRKSKSLKSDFDSFIPGWETAIDLNQGMKHIRSQVIAYWIAKLELVGVTASQSVNWKLISGKKNQPLYWLMLVAKHDLAHAFWAKAAKSEIQSKLFD